MPWFREMFRLDVCRFAANVELPGFSRLCDFFKMFCWMKLRSRVHGVIASLIEVFKSLSRLLLFTCVLRTFIFFSFNLNISDDRLWSMKSISPCSLDEFRFLSPPTIIILEWRSDSFYTNYTVSKHMKFEHSFVVIYLQFE